MKQSTPEKIASGAIRLGPAMTFGYITGRHLAEQS